MGSRIAQALPEQRDLLQRIADLLRLSLEDFGRQDFLFFLLGCVHGELLETSSAEERSPSSLVATCLNYIKDEQDNFKRDEVQKIVYLLWHAKKYSTLVDELPMSWKATKEETLDFIRTR